MHWIDWVIMTVPMLFVLGMGFWSRRYVKGVSDYLAAGRVAGRYVLSVGDVALALAVITMLGYVESHYKAGFGMIFWNNILLPLGVVMGLTGFCTYRFRETKAMSLGQFLEMRYNRPLRIYASALRSVAELLANCMCPALAARFLIYYIGLPTTFSLFGIEIPTFLIITLICIAACVYICCIGGALSLLITDTLQGFICYPLLVMFILFVVLKYPWTDVIMPTLMDRVAGESFLNPYDVAKIRDFNVFALMVTIYSSIVNRANWLGTSSGIAAKTPHEQKMAGIMGTWRNALTATINVVLVLLVIATLNHTSRNKEAKIIRDRLSNQVMAEVGKDNTALKNKLKEKFAAIPPSTHVIGKDAPLSHEKNIDTPHLQAVYNELKDTPEGQAQYQEFFTLYHQMMLPVTMSHILPVGMIGMFALFILLMMLSTDDTRLFSAAQTIAQDCILPFCKGVVTPEKHVLIIRLTVIGCGIFWFIGSFFMAQLDYINMFVTIMCSMWIGAGPMMLFGLYSKFGNTKGAFTSLVTGMVLSLCFIYLQRNWADTVYPWLVDMKWDMAVATFLENCSAPFDPWIVWRMNSYKFPINSTEINFIIMIICLVGYIAVSLTTFKEPYNLDRLLHRGIYDTENKGNIKEKWTIKNIFRKLIGITPEFTTGDKIISWSVFCYSVVFQFLLAFLLVIIWNTFHRWPLEWWGYYFFVVSVFVPIIAGIIASVWFITGGIIDLRKLFKALETRVVDPLDNGQVEGQVSLSDVARFEKAEEEEKEEANQ